MDLPEIAENQPQDHRCLLLTKPAPWICPLPIVSLFWKIAFGVFGILLVVCTVTMWLLSVYVSNLNHELRIAKDEVLAAQVKALETINSHKQLTLENRAIVCELKGVLNGWIEERRKSIKEDHPLPEKLK